MSTASAGYCQENQQILGLASENYRVYVIPGNTVYVREYYDDQLSWHDADPVTVVESQETVGIDFELAIVKVKVQKCKVKAGKSKKNEAVRGEQKFVGRDSISFAGTIDDITSDNLIGVNGIQITLWSTDVAKPLVEVFPVSDDYIKKYKSPKSTDKNDPKYSIKLDTKKGKFVFAAKNVDLTGLDCPLTLEIEIGDYLGAVQVNEDKVNGPKKLVPIQLMSGHRDRLRVDKIKVKEGKKKPSTDSLSVKGAFALADTSAPIGDVVLSSRMIPVLPARTTIIRMHLTTKR